MNKESLNFWTFSSEETLKQAEELAQEFSELDGDENQENTFLQSRFKLHVQPPPSLAPPADVAVEELLNPAWTNIDDAAPASEPEEEDEEEYGDLDDLNNDVDNIDLEAPSDATPMDTEETAPPPTPDRSLMVIQSQILKSNERYCLPDDLLGKLTSMSEKRLTALLHTMARVEHDTALVALCRTVCEMEDRQQKSLTALICSQVLLDKARTGRLEGQLLEWSCRLAGRIPSVVGPQLLAPLLCSEGDTGRELVVHFINTTESEELKHTMLRLWLEEEHPSLSSAELQFLQLLLGTPVSEVELARRVCRLFGQVGAGMAGSPEFAKLMLQTLKSLPKNLNLPEEVKQLLHSAVAANKTTLRKFLEKTVNSL